MPDIDIGWKVRLDDLQKQLKESSQLSNDEVRRMVNGLSSQFKRAEGEAAKAARKAEAEWTKSMDSLKGAAEKSLGMLGGPFAQLGDLVFDLGEKVGGAGNAVGSFGVIVGGAAVGVTALATAGFELASAAEASAKRLEEAGLAALIPPEAQASVEDYRGGLAALRTEVDVLTVQLGGPAMTAIGDLSYAIVGIGNAAENIIGPLSKVAATVSAAVDTPAVRALLALGTFGGSEAARAMSASLASAAASGRDVAAIRTAEAQAATAGKAAVETEIKARTAAVAVVEKHTTALKENNDAAQLEAEIARAVASDVAAAEKTKEDSRIATYESAKALNEQYAADQEARQQRMLEYEAESNAAFLASIENAKQAALARADAVANSLSSFSDLASAVYESIAEKGANATEQEKRTAKTAFAISKALSVSQALISGATAAITMAASPAYAALGPFGPALAAASAAAATGAALAQIASVKPPSFARGGMVDTDPDHRLIAARADEAVLTGRGVQAAGGPEAVRRMNEGGTQSGSVVHMYVDGRRLATASSNEWGSLLTGRPMGRRPAYG